MRATLHLLSVFILTFFIQVSGYSATPLEVASNSDGEEIENITELDSQEAVWAMVSRLSDNEVRSLLLEYLDNKVANESNASGGSTGPIDAIQLF